jgi:PhnB protein
MAMKKQVKAKAGKSKKSSKSAAKKSAAKKPMAKKSAAKKPPAKKPMAKKPAAKAAPAKASGVPTGFRSVTPYLCVEGAAKALDFYAAAFGGKEIMRLPGPDGRLMHAEMQIGDSMVMISDDFPEYCGGKSRSPLRLGGSSVSVHLYVSNVDKTFDRAVAAGCTVFMPVTDMFWGDRFGCVFDPFGHMWSIATNVKELTPEEIQAASAAHMAEQCSQAGEAPAS